MFQRKSIYPIPALTEKYCPHIMRTQVKMYVSSIAMSARRLGKKSCIGVADFRNDGTKLRLKQLEDRDKADKGESLPPYLACLPNRESDLAYLRAI